MTESPHLTWDCAPVERWSSTPYGLAFSPDGRRLAVGFGSWYGHGGLSLLELSTFEATTHGFGGPPPTEDARVAEDDDLHLQPLTVSGVAFAEDGRHLVASAWGSKQRGGGGFLFEVASSLRLRACFALPPDPEHELRDRCPTGVCIHAGELILRCNTHVPSAVFARHPLPADVGRAASPSHSHQRVVSLGTEVVTGGGGRHVYLGGRRLHDAEGFVVERPLRVIPTSTRVTSILARGDELLVGHQNGELWCWRREAEWRPARRLRTSEPRRRPAAGGPWATYEPESLVGLAELDARRFYSVDASGELLEWTDDHVSRRFALPRGGSPRSLAVHPDTPLGPVVAVGVKLEDRRRLGYVAIFAVDTTTTSPSTPTS
ncbi:MAG: hypothetical protein H6721_18365 [Sandaracinus sp.]|nr:hypothetical protein [Sandaracinus sp.]